MQGIRYKSELLIDSAFPIYATAMQEAGCSSSADSARDKSKLLMDITVHIYSPLPCKKQASLAVLTTQGIKVNDSPTAPFILSLPCRKQDPLEMQIL